MNDLGFWMAMFVFGALIYFETPLGRMIAAGARALWGATARDEEADEREKERRPRRVLPLRRPDGKLAGSVPYRKSTGRSSDRSSAPQSEVPGVTTVPEFPLTIPDMLIIAARLGQGMTPTDVAKSLPGYSGRKYAEYGDRVRHVKAILDEHGGLG